MSTICIPQNGSVLTLLEDWNVTLNWWKRNLRMLAKFNLTGMKEVCAYTGVTWNPEEQAYQSYTHRRRETVPNKLFMDYQGNYTPVEVTFPKDTKFILSRFNYSNSNGISSVDLKCLESGKPGIKGLCLQLPLEDFNDAKVSIEWPDEDES